MKNLSTTKTIPALCHQKFIDGWITAIKVKHDKFEASPALNAQCQETRVLAPASAGFRELLHRQGVIDDLGKKIGRRILRDIAEHEKV